MPSVSRVVLLAKTRQTFFEHPILEGELGHHLLQLTVFRAQLLDFVAGGFPSRIPGQLLLAGFQEVLAPAVVEVCCDALSAAEFRDALLTPQPLENDPDLLLRCEFPAGTAADLTHCRFGGLLLVSGHVETLLGVLNPVKRLLPYATPMSDFC